MATITVGIDIGQKRDPTAIAVVEALRDEGPATTVAERYARRVIGVQDAAALGLAPVATAPGPWVFHVRFLERLPLGTSYPDVVARIVQIRVNLEMQHPNAAIAFRIDATGVGQPIVDLLDEAGILVEPVIFAAGDRLGEYEDPLRGGTWKRLGKAYLVSRLQVLLQTGRVLLPDTDEARALARELQDYEIHISEDSAFTAGAFKTGAHDDLVTALGLSVMEEPRPYGGIWF
jgi:hypothetical protein